MSSSSVPASRAPASRSISPGAGRRSSSSSARPWRLAPPAGRPASCGCTTTSRASCGSPGCRSRTSTHGRSRSGRATRASCGPGSSTSMPVALAGALRANVAVEQGLGVRHQAVEPAEIARLVPGAVTDGLAVGAYEPQSGYADPSGTAAGFLAAARRLGRRLVQRQPGRRRRGRGRRGERRRHRSRADRRPGRRRSRPARGPRSSPGPRASTCRSSPGATTRPTSACRRATDRTSRSSSTRSTASTSGPRAATSCWSGWRAATRWAARRTGRSTPLAPATIEDMVRRVCARVPWMADGHVPHGPRRPGRDHARPAPDPRSGRSRTASTSPAGSRARASRRPRRSARCLAELILDGRTTTADISAYGLDRFAAGRPLRRRAPVRRPLALSGGRQRDQRRRPLARSAAGRPGPAPPGSRRGAASDRSPRDRAGPRSDPPATRGSRGRPGRSRRSTSRCGARTAGRSRTGDPAADRRHRCRRAPRPSGSVGPGCRDDLGKSRLLRRARDRGPRSRRRSARRRTPRGRRRRGSGRRRR